MTLDDRLYCQNPLCREEIINIERVAFDRRNKVFFDAECVVDLLTNKTIFVGGYIGGRFEYMSLSDAYSLQLKLKSQDI
mgnify:CR=1 FL=1